MSKFADHSAFFILSFATEEASEMVNVLKETIEKEPKAKTPYNIKLNSRIRLIVSESAST
jgi:hypothetical protein